MSEQPSKVQGRMQVSAVKVANAARALVEYLQEVADEQGRSTELAARILTLQGDGDYAGVGALLDSHGVIRDTLAGDLARLSEAGIPVDVVFEQGVDVLGLR